MKLPYEECIILGHNMPPYIGKKNVFYADERFNWKVFFEDIDTGEVKSGFAAPYKQNEIDREVYMLPSQIKKREKAKHEAKNEAVIAEKKTDNITFNPIDYLETFEEDENGICQEWDAPFSIETDDGEPPPQTSEYSLDDFDSEGDVTILTKCN